MTTPPQPRRRVRSLAHALVAGAVSLAFAGCANLPSAVSEPPPEIIPPAPERTAIDGGPEAPVLLELTDARSPIHVRSRSWPSRSCAPERSRSPEGRETIARNVFEFDGKRIPVTVSLGVGTIDPAMKAVEALIAGADAALYEAKETGRNRVVVATPDMMMGSPTKRIKLTDEMRAELREAPPKK